MSSASFRLSCFGTTLLHTAMDRDCTPSGRKARAILAFLALEAGHEVGRDKLASLLWSERGEEQARASLRQCLHEIRPLSTGTPPLLIVTPKSVQIAAGAILTDLDIASNAAYADDLEGLIAAWPGSRQFLGDLEGIDPAFDDWLRTERARQERALFDSAIGAGERGLAFERYREVRILCESLLERDPLNEEVARLAMQADAALGDRVSLRRRFSALKEQLHDELGIAPSPETLAQHQRLIDAAGPGERAKDVAHRPESKKSPRLAITALALLLIAGVAAFVWFQFVPRPPLAIAVLPFDTYAPTDQHYFAQGLSEEILAALARNPNLRVTGRTSAYAMKGLDAHAIGERLGVAYVVDGSVRTSAGRARIDAALIRTTDGTTLWTRQFTGSLNDIWDIQERIASDIEGQLRSQFFMPGAVKAKQLAVRGDAYQLYLTARGLLHERTRVDYEAAEGLLHRAVALDPGFAPAWASRAFAKHMIDLQYGPPTVAGSEAQDYARRALDLAPNLSEAHSAWAFVTDFATPAAAAHLKKAIALDPNNAEAWLWLGNSFVRNGLFSDAIPPFRHAIEIDPLWWPPVVDAIAELAENGHVQEAQEIASRVARTATDPALVAYSRVSLLLATGDFSGAAKLAMDERRKIPGKNLGPLEYMLGSALYPLGYKLEAARLLGTQEQIVRAWNGQPQSTDQLRADYKDAGDFWHDADYPLHLARALIPLRRGGDIADFYLRAFHSPEEFERSFSDWDLKIKEAVLILIALRDTGRHAEANRLQAWLGAEMEKALRPDEKPARVLFNAALLAAAEGKNSDAVTFLKQATDRGYLPSGAFDSIDPADEPAFASLRDQSAFKALCATIAAALARERSELGPIPPI